LRRVGHTTAKGDAEKIRQQAVFKGRIFLYRIFLVFSSYISSQVCLILLHLKFGEVLWHQSQCSIFGNQQLNEVNVSTFAYISNTEKQIAVVLHDFN